MLFPSQESFWPHYFCILLSLCPRSFVPSLAQNTWGNQKLWCHQLGTSKWPNMPKVAWPNAQPELQVMTPTFHLCNFILKPLFKLILFASNSWPWRDHFAQEKSQNARVDWNWLKLQHGTSSSAFSRKPKVKNHSNIHLGSPIHVHTCLSYWNSSKRMQNDLATSSNHTFHVAFYTDCKTRNLNLNSHEFASNSHEP